MFVDSFTPGRIPAFEEVEPDVKSAWLADQREQAWHKAYEAMRAKYTVSLPAPSKKQTASAPVPALPKREIPTSSGEGAAMSCVKKRLRCLFAGLVLAALLPVSAAWAHEVRPAYLELKETAPGRFNILWRTPLLSGMRLPVVLKLPDDVQNLKEPIVQELTDSLVERRWIDAGPGGLAGKRIEFVGLQGTITDVLVRVERLDGSSQVTRVIAFLAFLCCGSDAAAVSKSPEPISCLGSSTSSRVSTICCLFQDSCCW